MAFGLKKKKDKESAEDAGNENTPEQEEKEGKEEDKNSAKESGGEEKAEGSEAAEGESIEDAAAKKQKKTKKIVIGIACVVMLAVVAGAGAYFTGFIGHPKKDEEKTAPKETGAVVYYDLPQLLVNLNSGNKTPSFIKVTVTLELTSQEDVKTTQANMPRLLDSYNTFLREMKATDLYGSAGMYRLREEMLLRANTSLAPVKVKDVLFKEILVQ